MHAARIEKSDRLQRVLNLFKRARAPLSTLDIIRRARVCAVSAIVSELRQRGHEIDCRCSVGLSPRIWYYTLRAKRA